MASNDKTTFVWSLRLLVIVYGIISSEAINLSTNLTYPQGLSVGAITKVDEELSGKILELTASDCSLSQANPCENGGQCKNRVCQCLPGIHGDRCEIVNGCENTLAVRTKCGNLDNVECAFNQSSWTSFCQCKKQGQIYDDYNKECKECDCGLMSHGCSFQNGQKNCSCYLYYIQSNGTCKSDCTFSKANPCENGGQCKNRVCQCLSGTHGDRCEIVIGCEGTSPERSKCGRWWEVKCVFNQTSGTSICQCYQPNLVHDNYYEKCRECDCGKRGACSLFRGQKICDCEKGFEVDYRLGLSQCFDIDECMDKYICPPKTQCKNTEGSYECICNKGYRPYTDNLDTRRYGCIDINECMEKNICPPNTQCNNTEGSYECVCNKGYRPYTNHSDTKRYGCIDIDECMDKYICRRNTQCKNTEGSYDCNCNKGYRPRPDRPDTKLYGCIENDVCSERKECPFRDTTDCVNKEGSYYCRCKPGYYRRDTLFTVSNWEELYGCEEDLTGWMIGYIVLLLVFAIVYFGILFAIYKRRKLTPASNPAS